METLLKVSSKWLLAFLSYIEELKRVITLRPNPKSFRPTGCLMTVIKLQKVLIQRVCQSSVLITLGWNEHNLIGSKLEKQKYSEGQWWNNLLNLLPCALEINKHSTIASRDWVVRVCWEGGGSCCPWRRASGFMISYLQSWLVRRFIYIFNQIFPG